MKNINVYDSLLFVTGFEVKDDKIYVHYADPNETKTLDLNDENINLVYSYLQKQIDEGLLNRNYYLESLKKKKFWSIYSYFWIHNSLFNAITHSQVWSKVVQGIVCAGFSILFNLYMKEEEEYREKIKEIDKYKFFIDNEDIINYEIIRHSLDSSESNIPNYDEIPTLTINDINDITLTELKETVELIKQNYNDEELDSTLKGYRLSKKHN